MPDKKQEYEEMDDLGYCEDEKKDEDKGFYGHFNPKTAGQDVKVIGRGD